MRWERRWRTADAGSRRDWGRRVIRRWGPCAVAAIAVLGAAAVGASAEPLVYVSNERRNTITVIDAATDKVAGTIPVGKRPRGIGVSPDGRTIYVALGNDNVIAAIDAASRAVKSRFSAGSDPETFAVSPDGARLYVSNED